VVGTDRIVVSYSTITSAIHIAAYMGAANIIIVGHDCGTLDGEVNFPGYGEAIGGSDFYRQFITEIEPQTLTLREKIKEVYGCNLYSLNPFINFGLEGHEYHR
jgi:carbonic anhydrase